MTTAKSRQEAFYRDFWGNRSDRRKMFVDQASWDKSGHSPATVAAYFAYINADAPHTAIPASILKATANAPRHRAKIPVAQIVSAYENAIAADRDGMGRESGAAFADRSTEILKYTHTDPRVNATLSAGYVFGKFMDAVSTGALVEAVIRFESTEDAPTIRALFNSHALASLAHKSVLAEHYDGVMKVLANTENDGHLRAALTPELMGLTVKGALQKYAEVRDYDGKSHPHYAYVIIRLLELTIADARLRAGIDPKDIARLQKLIHENIETAREKNRFSPHITIKHCEKFLTLIDYATLDADKRKDIGNILTPVLDIIDASTYRSPYHKHPKAHLAVDHFDLDHYRNCRRVLSRYPEAKDVPFTPFTPYPKPVLVAAA